MIVLPFCLGLLSGAINSITSKAAYQTIAIGLEGKETFFNKPWFLSFVMFASMALALPLYVSTRNNDAKVDTLSMNSILLLALPTILDLIGTSIQQMGLTIIPVSTFQMLKGSIVIFSAIFSNVFLGNDLRPNQRIGIVMCFIALCVVGMAAILIREDQVKVISMKETFLGIFLVVTGQIVCAGQYVLEEFFLKHPSMNVHSLALVGIEGVWGSLIMVFVVFPLLQVIPGDDRGVMEDWRDTVSMVSNSAQIRSTLLSFFLSCLIFNICGVMVTHKASAIHHTFLDSSRTIFVWVGSLYLYYYSTSDQDLGEPWSEWSWLQAVGFALLVVAQIVYDSDAIREDPLAAKLLV